MNPDPSAPPRARDRPSPGAPSAEPSPPAAEIPPPATEPPPPQPSPPPPSPATRLSPESPPPAGLPAFPTAPRLYGSLLGAELLALKALQRAGVRFGEHGDDPPPGNPANHRRNPYLGHLAAERLAPGIHAPAGKLVAHINRYLWALPRVEGRRVLDVGCGTGYGSFLLSWTGASVIGVDVDPGAVAFARAHYPGVDFREAAAGAGLPETIDVATCFEVLEHVADPDAVLEAIASQSRRLLLSFPNPLTAGSHLNPHHVNDWPLARLRARLRAAGFVRQETFHQPVWSPAVRRGGRLWAGVWLLDANLA